MKAKIPELVENEKKSEEKNSDGKPKTNLDRMVRLFPYDKN